MSIIRTTEGEHITEIEKGWTVFTDEFEAYAGQCSHFTAKDGTVHGQPLKDENKELKYFKDGWWSSDAEGSNRITEAKIGDNVYFNIEMKNIKEDDIEVDLQLYDDDGWLNPPDPIDIVRKNVNGENVIVKSKPIVAEKVSFSLTLSTGLIEFIEDDFDDEIELYFECGYKEEKKVKLPFSAFDYLKVSEKEILITVIVELPHSKETGWGAKGLAGHSAMAIGEKYFDYGPNNRPGLYSENTYGADFNKDGDEDDEVYLDDPTFKFSPGMPWWGTHIAIRKKIIPTEVTLNMVLEYIQLDWEKDGTYIYGKVYKIEFYVKESEANKMLEWWKDRYNRLKIYSAFPWTGEQCTTTVKLAIQEAFPFIKGINWIAKGTQKPSGMLNDLKMFKSTSKEHYGEPARISVIKEEADDFYQ